VSILSGDVHVSAVFRMVDEQYGAVICHSPPARLPTESPVCWAGCWVM